MIALKLKQPEGNFPQSLPSRAIKTGATSEGGTKKGHSRACYKLLPTRFRRDGFNYWQIAREGNAAIYAQIWSRCANSNVSYEVIRIHRRRCFQIDGRLVKPAEVYPNSEAWGRQGFTFTDKDAAFAKLQELAAQ
jgi:hypothetical protein